jgi:hypothetical protein
MLPSQTCRNPESLSQALSKAGAARDKQGVNVRLWSSPSLPTAHKHAHHSHAGTG